MIFRLLGLAMGLVGSCAALADPYRLDLDLPVYDSAAKKSSGFSPSLGQAQALTQDFYLGAHGLIAHFFSSESDEREDLQEALTIAAFDFLSQATPLGLSWLHEEAHRAVLSQHGISSHNGVYDTPFGASSIPVDRVRDADLARLKQKRPADFVRLATAGMEAESEFALSLEKAQFFEDALPRQRFLLLLAHLGPISYRSFCDSRQGDAATARDLTDEGSDELQRDFTGYDCVAYVYDLFRPDEPYAARGQHPSGQGIKRYRSRDDLTTAERRYLHQMSGLAWINLIDPFLLPSPGWSWRGDGLWTLTLRHHLAPFGHSFAANVFLRDAAGKHLLIMRSYSNQKRSYPGFEWQCLDCVSWSGRDLTIRSGLWWQPRDQLFASEQPRAGGFLALRLQQPWLQNTAVFGELLHKTAGWMPDESSLDAATYLRLGFSFCLSAACS